MIKNTPDTVFDRAHFFSYGDFSLIFEVVYYAIGPDCNKYMDMQQQINFAYPTQALYLQKEK